MYKERFHYQNLANVDNFGFLKKRPDKTNHNQFVIRIDADMMRINKIIKYFSYADIFAKLGGYKALIGPLFVALIPFSALSYLHKLSRIIK